MTTTNDLADNEQSVIDWLKRKAYSEELIRAVQAFNIAEYYERNGIASANETIQQIEQQLIDGEVKTTDPTKAPHAVLPQGWERVTLT